MNTFSRTSALSRAAADEMDRGSGAPRIDLIPIESIEPDPENHRYLIGNKESDPQEIRDTFRELVESIRNEGLRDPIKVLPPSPTSRMFRIRDGHRRYHACVAAGLAEVEVIVRQRTLREVRSEQLISNVTQERPNPFEIYTAIDQCIAEGMSGDEVAAAVGKGKSWVSNYRAIGSFPEALQAALRDGSIRDVHVARKLAKLNSDDLDSALANLRSGEPTPSESLPAQAPESPSPDRRKRAKPIELNPIRAEHLLLHLRSLHPELFIAAGLQADDPLPDRSRRSAAFRKLFDDVLTALEPKAEA